MNKKEKIRQADALKRSGNPEHKAKANSIKRELAKKTKQDKQDSSERQTNLFE